MPDRRESPALIKLVLFAALAFWLVVIYLTLRSI